MGILKSIRKNLVGLDKKVLPSALRGRKAGIVIGTIAGAAIGLAGILGTLRYHEWRNGYAYPNPVR